MTTTRKTTTRTLARMVFSIFVIPFLLLSGSVASSKSSVHEHHRRQQKATTAAARKTTTREKSIDVSLVSSLFPATSRALETAEAISTCCGEEKFWQFVRVWRNQNALNGKRCQRFIESAMRRAVGGEPRRGAAAHDRARPLSPPRFRSHDRSAARADAARRARPLGRRRG